MKIIAVIPARYASTRFPAKLMKDLGGKTIILRTYQAAINTNLFDDVFVVTDSDIIYNEISSNGGKAIMSVKEHESGSDRIAEAVANLDVDIVVNVQGDEPFIDKDSLQQLISVYHADVNKNIETYRSAFDKDFILMDNDPEARFEYNPEYVKQQFFKTVKGSGKKYSPEELVKKKEEIDAMNQEVASLLTNIPDFITIEDAKSKINSFLK